MNPPPPAYAQIHLHHHPPPTTTTPVVTPYVTPPPPTTPKSQIVTPYVMAPPPPPPPMEMDSRRMRVKMYVASKMEVAINRLVEKRKNSGHYSSNPSCGFCGRATVAVDFAGVPSGFCSCNACLRDLAEKVIGPEKNGHHRGGSRRKKRKDGGDGGGEEEEEEEYYDGE
uniref:Uncharacterized protein n=1 Tax=Leersia perrieri TaxID=77586 RepID=A0A0D9XZK4_9ORYZ